MTPPHFNTYQSSYNNPQLQQQFPSSQYGTIHPTQHYSSTTVSIISNESLNLICFINFLSITLSFYTTYDRVTSYGLLCIRDIYNSFHHLNNPDGQAVQTIIHTMLLFKLRILILMILIVMMSRMQKRFSWPIFPTMVLTSSWSESKEKEDKYMENKIDLEKKIKELHNILFKVGQSTQTVHMLTKPQAFYDNIHKQALGYQNPFHLKKAQRIKPTVYDGIVMFDKHVAMPVIAEEETLIVKEDSRSKILTEDFRKRFTPQQELSAEQAFWLRMSDPTSKHFDALPVKIEAPKELPKISLVNESLKKLKFHFAKFDNVVKIRTTPNASTEGEWGFKYTKAIFNNEIIPFLKSLKDIFNVFDRDLLNEIIEELLFENDRLLQQIMSQDVLLTVMNSMSLIGDTVNMDGNRKESCNLEAELLQSQNAFNDLLKKIFENNDLKAQLQDKDSTICKLKDIIKSLREKSKEENVNYDYCEIETKNVELENSVAKLLSENERLCNEINHVKQVFKEQFDSIKKTRVRSKEQSDSLIDKLNLKSAENEDLKAQIQDKVFVITSLKNDLQKLKGKEIVDIAAQIPSTNTIVPGMFKLDLEPLAPRIEVFYYRNIKNKVEAQPRASNKKNRVVEPICDVYVKHSQLNSNSEPICATCNKSMFDGVYDKYLLDFVENVNSRAKSAKKHKKQNIWKPTGHVFTEVRFKYKPTGGTFTIVDNLCPLTWITSANIVPPNKTTSHSVETQKPELKVYSRKPKNVKNVGSSKKDKIVESKNANPSEPNHTWGSNATDIPSSSSLVMTVRFGNDHITRIMGYGVYQLGNVTISRVYYVEGLRHNLFSIGQFCYGDLEVAFRKNACFIRNLKGVDLLSGSRDTNLYTISLDDMLKTSPICLLSKSSKTKSWLWHRRLSHLNFGTINKLAKDGLARGIPRLKFQKDHLCFACALGKSKKSSHQPEAEDTNQEKLYLLHMDLCGPMRVASINRKRYILVIVDDYSRFTWVRFLRTKDEAPEAIIKCIKNIQVRLNATVRNVRTDNGTEFVNQTLREFYENVGISHQTSVACTPQ
ncbi:retrovirus-related pol polyprotein from transposon TNT 1-94 [Tanacetum coccineum]